MKPYSIISSLLLAVSVSGAAAQEQSKLPELVGNRPLNLSVRKPVAAATASALLPLDNKSGANAQTSAGISGDAAGTALPIMRYGSGYESRQQNASTGGGGTSAGGGNGGKSGSGGEGGKGGSDGGGKGGDGGGKGGKGGDSGHGS
jgi:hypothetical protein